MSPRFITKSIHAYLDYPVALGLVAMPLWLGLGSENALAFWLSVATGVAAAIRPESGQSVPGPMRIRPRSSGEERTTTTGSGT